ncbi:hypothetical protein EDC01DRAFT_468359 [Geopyxis carbonaria]|nr:hypothetical protein EDC01DRAFT_468359 [Geopyxis carbonaria]
MLVQSFSTTELYKGLPQSSRCCLKARIEILQQVESVIVYRWLSTYGPTVHKYSILNHNPAICVECEQGFELMSMPHPLQLRDGISELTLCLNHVSKPMERTSRPYPKKPQLKVIDESVDQAVVPVTEEEISGVLGRRFQNRKRRDGKVFSLQATKPVHEMSIRSIEKILTAKKSGAAAFPTLRRSLEQRFQEGRPFKEPLETERMDF